MSIDPVLISIMTLDITLEQFVTTIYCKKPWLKQNQIHKDKCLLIQRDNVFKKDMICLLEDHKVFAKK